MGFMIPCCVCGTMLTSFVQKKAFKITRQVKFNYKGEVTLDQELDFERPVCDSCVARMEGEGHIFDAKTGVVVKHYAEDGKSAIVPTPDIAIPERSKPLIQTTPPTPRLGFKDVQIAYMIDGGRRERGSGRPRPKDAFSWRRANVPCAADPSRGSIHPSAIGCAGRF
jgi:hypothetical protein